MFGSAESSNNKAIITSITVSEHPNANKVQLGKTKLGQYQVIVGMEAKDGDLGIYFPVNTRIGKDFAKHNEKLLTYFGKNLRVRQQKFRGEWSEGFWCPISTLDFITSLEQVTDNLVTTVVFKEGVFLDKVWLDEGLELEICTKYVVPNNQKPSLDGLRKKLRRGSLLNFQKHLDTSHLRLNLKECAETSKRIVITLKLHGTSGRTGLVEVQKDLPGWILRGRRLLGLSNKEFKVLTGSRNIILDDQGKKESWYSETFRQKASALFASNLIKHEVVYYEIVGYDGASPLFKHSLNTIKDASTRKEMERLYPNQIIYDYGLDAGEFDIYVYRIAYELPNGTSIDLTWDELKVRCEKLGIKHVPEYKGISDIDILAAHLLGLRELQEKITTFDPIDAAQPMEGICVRLDSTSPVIYKLKNPMFLMLEGFDNHVDLEESS